ncbi:hypothetical protein ACH5RR_020233 [Cinchona calisaya]|uniref:PSII 6.1 kDa protein n=1 Tax=Cinchona calisaya TaxID=153742 RepID=A0ABD2ZF36_9GENT
MASITAYTTTSSVKCIAVIPKASLVSPASALAMTKMGEVRCSVEGKSGMEENESKLGMGASLMAAACAAATMSSPAAMALVDERMSTEGTGLPFGLSNNLLGWILFGVFG